MPPPLAAALRDLGPVARFRTPSLWDAIATAIIRQVIRAGQARLQHQRLRTAHGPAVATERGPVHALPSPQTILEMTDDDFAALGMTFKARPLRNAAAAYLDHSPKWAELPPGRLVEELQTVPRIGPWTAGAATADFTHDWSLYPYGDLAVRTWAATAAPDHPWPADEHGFAAHWRALTGEHVGVLTLFTLALGAHHAGAPAPSPPPRS
ncbi:DNA glycosylase family protein [Actinomadura macrotermitis]|uniref:hypothetical protein n=1 Tax=Actinomadura macrotermitis TaxID=2585200 RepID=UPI001A9A8131|nr:hypothetical protein [Actinomadura macrotermitis]